MANSMGNEPRTYAEVKERLEEIVEQVRDKDLSLEKSLDLYEEAVRLGNRCSDLVDKIDFSATEREALIAQQENAAADEATDETADEAVDEQADGHDTDDETPVEGEPDARGADEPSSVGMGLETETPSEESDDETEVAEEGEQE